ncbi:MAG: STAS domain-containing protein [Nocardioidaceae bacterium]|nr:STAS domain-containing protein [Nocardioidaceae bacterium]
MPPSKLSALPDGRALVTLVGELDLAVAPDLVTEMEYAVDQVSPHLVLDLTGVDFIDSSGLTMLIRVRQITDDRGGSLVLTGAGEALEHLLTLTRLDELFDVRPRSEVIGEA